MYFGKNKHLLSKTLIAAALVNLVSVGVIAFARLMINRAGSLAPDMVESATWRAQVIISTIQLVLTCGVFLIARKRLADYMKLIPEEDREEMGRLQEETFGDNIANLSADAIRRLLEIWAVILIGVQFVYDITSIVYRNFIFQLFGIFTITGLLGDGTFLAVYNSTHGFKYLGMLIAIFLGIMMTGIFLNDKLLKLISALLTVLFLLSFSVMQMSTFTIFGRDIGIVWTSFLFHIIDTAGLLGMAVYLRKRYLGV